MKLADGNKGVFDQGGSSVNSNLRPDSRTVNELHTNDDLDRDAQAHHHSLGTGVNQAARGSHKHDGADSLQLGEGISITGSRASGAALLSVLSALETLGFQDNTTA